MKKHGLLLALLLIATPLTINAAKSEKNDDHYTVIVSIDGFRWDYCSLYHTPNIDRIGKAGVKATMTPSFPSSTYPNHYTIATGLTPDHHGIVHSYFYDYERGTQIKMSDLYKQSSLKYYGGEPIWNTAQRQGVKVGTIYWIGSEFPIQGTYPAYFCRWSKWPHTSFNQRVDEVIDMLKMPEDKRPRLIMAYFEEPDHTSHLFGPGSDNVGKKVEEMDSLVGKLWRGIRKLPIGKKVNIIITSDHGHAEISDERNVPIKRYLKPEWCDCILEGLPAMVYPKPEYKTLVYNTLKANVKHALVCYRDSCPEHLKWGKNKLIGDILILPETGWVVREKGNHLKGEHGFDTADERMHVIFRAVGPDFKKHYQKVNKFSNIDLYSLLCSLINIKPAENDGSLANVKDMMKDKN
jgi:predicted AlkP superfamily pyrophosphatase or phosphodiesterase